MTSVGHQVGRKQTSVTASDLTTKDYSVQQGYHASVRDMSPEVSVMAVMSSRQTVPAGIDRLVTSPLADEVMLEITQSLSAWMHVNFPVYAAESRMTFTLLDGMSFIDSRFS